MKRNLIFAAIAVVALSSCSKDETVSINGADKGVDFGVLNNKVQSRATETTVGNIGSFTVYAYEHTEAATPTFTTPFYNGVVINATDAGVCTYNTPAEQKMWPVSNKLDFYAYAPAASATYTVNTPKLTVDMTSQTAAADQKDIVFAKTINQTGYQVTNFKSQLKFSHALAQIQFKAKSKYATVKFTVKSVTITGVSTRGETNNLSTWTATTPDGAGNTGNGILWTLTDATNNVANFVAGVDTENATDITSEVNITAANGALMVIPQTLKGGTPISKGGTTVADILKAKDKSYIVITYSAKDVSGATLVTNGRCAAQVSTDLKAGLRYTYTLTLAGNGDGGTDTDWDKLYPIDFECIVDGWTDSSVNTEI